MTNKFNIKLNEEEQERYNHLKELSLRHYPQIADDNVMTNLSEYLYLYYAKKGCLPEPDKSQQPESIDALTEPKIIEYKTPANAGDTLIRD